VTHLDFYHHCVLRPVVRHPVQIPLSDLDAFGRSKIKLFVVSRHVY
jgi:hypothetical protein